MRARHAMSYAALAVAVQTAGCSGNQSHRPYIGQRCVNPPCGAGVIVGGGSSSGAGGSGSDAGADASTPSGAVCTTDPTTQVELCSSTPLCSGLVLDSTLTTASCGFVDIASGVLDLECICSLTDLCPIAVQTSCDQASSLAASADPLEICDQVATGACKSLNSVPGVGQVGQAGGTSTTP